jgi:hypothetical protein
VGAAVIGCLQLEAAQVVQASKQHVLHKNVWSASSRRYVCLHTEQNGSSSSKATAAATMG